MERECNIWYNFPHSASLCLLGEVGGKALKGFSWSQCQTLRYHQQSQSKPSKINLKIGLFLDSLIHMLDSGMLSQAVILRNLLFISIPKTSNAHFTHWKGVWEIIFLSRRNCFMRNQVLGRTWVGSEQLNRSVIKKVLSRSWGAPPVLSGAGTCWCYQEEQEAPQIPLFSVNLLQLFPV